MPQPTTFRDVAPILEDLREKIKIPQIAKSDMSCRKIIAEYTDTLCSLDIESVTIETHSLGEIGRVLANTVRNYCAEIACRIQTFRETFSPLDKKNRSKRDEFDDYDIEFLFKELDMLQDWAIIYKGSLVARNKIPMPPDCTMPNVNRDIFAYNLDETRENWLKQKRKFLDALRKSIEFDEFIELETPPIYNRLRYVCSKILQTADRYFPPCEIQLHKRMTETFEKYLQRPSGSYVRKVVEIAQTPTETNNKQNWEGELFPMILVSELYSVCYDVFDNPTETQFHSSLNLHGKHEPIKIKPKQTIKACYLISKLYEIVPAKHKTAWREDILAHLGIDWSYYEKKYCHPRGSEASASSRAYADEVDAIFKNHRKRA